MNTYSSLEFNRIFTGKEFDLPRKWDGKDFYTTLSDLYTKYTGRLQGIIKDEDLNEINELTNSLLEAVKQYLNGFPADAFSHVDKAMEKLNKHKLKIYEKSADEQFWSWKDDPLRLFRVRGINCNKEFTRREIFHIPYNQRTIVSPSRYSIAGYPCLYLGTSLKQCCEEIYVKPAETPIIVSSFILVRNIKQIHLDIKIIELGIKPQDFRRKGNQFDTADFNQISKRSIPYGLLQSKDTKTAYLLWYPLIAACSFIRAKKKYPFSAEYIIPQLLMQWIRSKVAQEKELYGIRYFSCANKKASEMGYTYVFPTSGEQESDQFPYCPILTKAFRLTKPVYINDYKDILDCEQKLRDMDIDRCYKSPKEE